MKKVILLPATALLMAAPVLAGSETSLGLGSLPVTGTVEERFQSYNVEMVEITGGRFWAPFGGPADERYRMRPPVDLGISERGMRLRNLARHLGPAYIRVSGTWANSTYLPLAGEAITAPPAGFNQVLSRDQWRGVVAFAKAVDAKIVTSFPASNGARDANGSWNPEQAQRLIDLTREAGGSIYGAELFNEPTMPQHGAFTAGYSAADFGRDFRIFRKWAKTYAPDLKLTGAGGTAEGTMLKHGSGQGGVGALESKDLMEENPGSLDIVSYHHYGTVSTRCGKSKFGTPDHALSAEWLNQTAIDADFYAALRDRLEPGKPLWLNETAQAACGGSPWASSFLDSFRYLNQNGILAQKGVAVMAHNTLAASDYGLIDQDTLTPRPNYWAAVLWKRTMGAKVLAAPASPSPDLRLYAHCLPGSKGGVGLLAINTGTAPQRLTIGKRALRWTLTAAPLDSKTVSINGNVPAMDKKGQISGLRGVAIKASAEVPAQAISFIAATGANNRACR